MITLTVVEPPPCCRCLDITLDQRQEGGGEASSSWCSHVGPLSCNCTADPNPKALRTHMIGLLGPKTIIYRAFGAKDHNIYRAVGAKDHNIWAFGPILSLRGKRSLPILLAPA